MPDQKYESNELSPIQIPHNMGVRPGYGINPVTGNQTTMGIPGVQPFPQTSPSNMKKTKTQWALIQTQSEFSKNWAIEGSVSGNYSCVKGSLSASYATQEEFNASQVVLPATCLNMDGQYMMDPYQQGLDFSNVVAKINELGYDAFVNEYGSHFVAGVIYGSQCIASYTTTFESSAAASSATSHLSASFGLVKETGKVTADYTEKASESFGYQSQSGNQISDGSFTPEGPANPDTINANLAAFPGDAPGLPLWYVCWDWRAIPQIAKAAGQSDIDWAKFYSNLGNVRKTLSSLVFNQSSAQSAKPIGATSTASLSKSITDTGDAITEVLGLTPRQVANFNAAKYAGTVSEITNIMNISNGQAKIRLQASTDDAFNPNPPAPKEITIIPSDDFVSITTKHQSKGNTWAFGFTYASGGCFDVRVGVKESKTTDGFSGEWQGNGTLNYSAINTDLSVPLDNGSYPWITAQLRIL